MQEREFVDTFAELVRRVRAIERWMDQWGSRDWKVQNLNAKEITALEGYLVNIGRGLCANRHMEMAPPNQSYQVGETVLQSISPGEEYHSLLPMWWVAPPKVGDIETIIRFSFNDGTLLDRRNDGAENLEDWHPNTYLFFKDGTTCTAVSFVADNVGSEAQTQQLEIFKFQGWQF